MYFVVYPDKNSGEFPMLKAQFVMNGRVLATQKSVLPAPIPPAAFQWLSSLLQNPGITK